MKKRFLLGILFFSLSYLQLLVPKQYANPIPIVIFFFLFMVGSILICDATTLKLRGKSLINVVLKSRKNIISFLLVSFIAAFVIELVAHWLGKLWIYPHWGYISYFIFFVPAFFVYWLLICESYLATKTIFDYFIKGKKYVKKRFKWEHALFPILWTVGWLLIVLSILTIQQDYLIHKGLIVGAEDMYKQTQNYLIPFGSIMLLALGLWFVLEFIEYKTKGSSLIKDLAHNYLTPLLSILVGSLVLAFVMESQNLAHKLWAYINWPFSEVTLIGLPLTMFLVWPLHYILFLSFFRIANREESSEVWKGDLIK